MEYKINQAKLGSGFFLPTEVADKHIKLAGAMQLKVLLFAYRHIAEPLKPETMALALNISVNDVEDALGFWCELGYFISEQSTPVIIEPKRTIRKAAIKPSREEIVELSLQDDKIRFILNEAQAKFGRLLRQNETSTLVWLYADEGMSPAVLLMAIDYCVSQEKTSIGYIEKLCIDWLNNGVDTIAAAEERITLLESMKNAWHKVSSAFGLAKRAPSSKEEKLSYKWVYEYGFSRAMLKEAYNKTVDNLGEYNSKYIEKILESWHKEGIKTLEELESFDINKEKNTQKSKQKNDYAAYDKSEFKKKLENDYN